jgi:hypothetical protein
MKEHMYQVYSTKNIRGMAKQGTADPSTTGVDGSSPPGHSLPVPDSVVPSPRLFFSDATDQVVREVVLVRWGATEEEHKKMHTTSLLEVFDESEDKNECDADTREKKKKSENEEELQKTPEAEGSSTTSSQGEAELQAVEDIQAELIDEVSALTAISVLDFRDISCVHFGAMIHKSLRLIVSFCHLAAHSCDVDDPADPTEREAGHDPRQGKEDGAALLFELMQSAKQMLSVGMSLLQIFKQRRAWMEVEERRQNAYAAKQQDGVDEERRRTFLFILRSVINALKRFTAWRQGLLPLPLPAAAPVVGRDQVVEERPVESDVHLLESPIEGSGHAAAEVELDGVGQLEAMIRALGEDAASDHVATAATEPIRKFDEQQAVTELLDDHIITGLLGEVANQEVPRLAEEVRRPLADAPAADTLLRQGQDLCRLVDVLREACQTGAVPSWQDLAGLVLVLLRSSRGVAKFTALSQGTTTRRRLLALECAVVRLMGEAVRHARGMAGLMQIAAAAAQQRHEDLVEGYRAAVHEVRHGLRLRLGDLLSAVGQLLTAVHHEFSAIRPWS